MSYKITSETLADIEAHCKNKSLGLDWPSVFVLPDWLRVWQRSFGAGKTMYLRAVRDGERIIGIAPLLRDGGKLTFQASTDVCDYDDFITLPGRETDFFNALLDSLKGDGVRTLELAHVRPDSAVLTKLAPLAEKRGCAVTSVKEDVSVEMDLPATFEAYLESLDTKQRHEIRRKLRRLQDEGKIEYRFIASGPELHRAMDTFYRMFTESREDKAAFLTEPMKAYFNLLAETFAANGLLRLGVLELDGKPVAEILCFDYRDCIYLYNSGYDPGYTGLSAGLLSKVYAIKDSIEKGKKRFDFLKGAEVYKYRLGGREVPLSRCTISLQ